jgi:hypothetical protein
MQESSASPPDIIANNICKSCGNSFHGFYCNLCGEKVLTPADRTFKGFYKNVFTLVDPLNNRFLHTLKTVISRPGSLSREFVEGKRVKFVRPLQLFFLLNLIYFLFPILQLFNSSLRTQMYLRTHSQLVRKMVRARLHEEGYSLQGFELMYNSKSISLAKLLVIVFVVLACLPMNIIYRKRNRFFNDHFTLAVELTSFNLAVNAILLSIVLMVVNNIIHMAHREWESYLDDVTLTVIFVMTNAYFLFNAGRTFYNQRGFVLILKVLLGLVGLFVALEVFRLALFLVTFYAL